MGADVLIDGNAAVERVRATLRGPVLHVLAAGIPDVKGLPVARRYDALLGDLPLLEKSFAYFREHRDLFKAVLVDAEQHPVADDSLPLSCGRSLDDAVAMIVRSAAYRYFRQRLDGKAPEKPAAKPKPKLLASMLPFLAGTPPPPPRPKPSKAKVLYHSIRDYLRYDWQIPLVPTYSQLSPGDVAKLGPRIADLKSADEVLVASGRPPTTPAAAPGSAVPGPAITTRLSRVDLAALLDEDGKSLWVETLSRTLRDPEVIEFADNGEQAAHIKAALKAVGRDTLRCLVEDIGFDKRQLAVCLVRMLAVVPRSAFEQVVRGSINSAPLVKLVAMAKRQHIGPHSTLKECADFVTAQFTRPFAPGGGPEKA